MKEKDIKKKIPWYARYSRWVTDVVLGRRMIGIAVIIFILASFISYGILNGRPITPYEEAYDIEFKNYVNEKFNEISYKVIEEGIGINSDQIPEIVLEYSITWKDDLKNFCCVLNTEKIISEYNMKTGKNPFHSYKKDEFKMDIEISKDYQIVNQSTSVENPPTYLQYHQTVYPRQLIKLSLAHGLLPVLALCVLSFFISISTLVPAIATEIWRNKHPDLYNEYFHKENN